MRIDDLARLLADPKILALDESDAKKLGLRGFDAMRGELLSQEDPSRGHVGIYALSIFVVDDTDLLGKGEIYWWALPMIGTRTGKITWSASAGLPTGAAPVKTGDMTWMKSPALSSPHLLTVISPDPDVVASFIRFGLYDDDMAPVDVAKGLRAACEAMAELPSEVASEEEFLKPVREALWTALIAKHDDLLVEGTVRFLREEGFGYSAGNIGSLVSEKAQVYYVAKDEARTVSVGPFKLGKDDSKHLDLGLELKPGGLLAYFVKGGKADTTFGPVSNEMPFRNVYLGPKEISDLAGGLKISGGADALEVVAFYTPPR